MSDDFSRRSFLARKNKGLLDLRAGEQVVDEEGQQATFVSYGVHEPLYVTLRYPVYGICRIPNSNLKRLLP